MIFAFLFPFIFLVIIQFQIIKASIVKLNSPLEVDFISSINLLNENNEYANELHIECNQTLLSQYHIRKKLKIIGIGLITLKLSNLGGFFLEETSAFRLENLRFEQLDLLWKSKFLFISLKKTISFEISNSSFEHFLISDNSFSALINVNSEILLQKSIFNNLEFQTGNLFFFNVDELSLSSTLSIVNCVFRRLKAENADLIKIQNFKIFNIDSSIFNYLSSKKSILLLYNNEVTIFTNNSFSFNQADDETINIYSSAFLNIENLLCQYNNNIEDHSDIGNGGCLRTFHSHSRILKNIIITDSLSMQKAIGLKIVDETSNLNEYYLSKFGNPAVNISDCIFINNHIFYLINNETGGAIYLNTEYPIQINESFFVENTINSSRFPDKKIGGACLNNIRKNSFLNIDRSFFSDNKGKFLGNCIFTSGSSVFVTNSYFANNTGMYDDVIEQFYLKLSSVFATTRVYFHTEDGGAIHAITENITISHCYFKYNSAFRGGGVFFGSNALYYFSYRIMILSFCIFVKNEAGFHGPGASVYEPKQKIKAIVSDCYFLENFANQNGGALSSIFNNPLSKFFLENSIFEKNVADLGGAYYNIWGSISLKNNKFIGNRAIFMNFIGACGAIMISRTTISNSLNSNLYFMNYAENKAIACAVSSEMTEVNSYFIENLASVASALLSYNAGKYYVFNLKIFNNISTKKGIVATSDFGLMYCSGILGKNNIAARKGGFFLIESGILKEFNSTILDNQSDEGGIFFGIDNINYDLSFQNTILMGNSALSSLISIENSASIYFTNVTFIQNKNLLFSTASSKVYLLSSRIFDLKCDNLISACLAYFTQKASLFINSVDIKNVTHSLAEGGIRMINSFLNVTKTSFLNLKTIKKIGSCFSGINSKLEIFNISVQNYEINCIYLSESYLNLTQSFFAINDEKYVVNQMEKIIQNFGTIWCEKCYSLNIKNSVFDSNQVINGGAITLSSLDFGKENKIEGSIFKNNKVENKGGAILLQDANLNISNCSFVNNLAKEGGSIFFQGNASSNLIIYQTNFTENRALENGGAIKWLLKEPQYILSSFIGNKAVYGDSIASVPIRMRLDIFDKENNSYHKITKENLPYLKNCVSGGSFKYHINIQFVDFNDIIISSLNDQEVFLTHLNEEKAKKMNISDVYFNYFKFIKGKTNVKIENGMAEFDSLSLNGKPNSIDYLLISTEVISNFNTFYLKDTYSYEKNVDEKYYVVIKIDFRKCIEGEIYVENINACLPCLIGTYSLLDGMKSFSCKSCFPGVKCPGGNFLDLLSGYWRSSNKTDEIYSCSPYSYSCLGGFENNCEEGYTGPLCASCQSNYGKQGLTDCMVCAKKEVNTFVFLMMILILFVLIIVFVFVSLKEMERKDQITISNVSFKSDSEEHDEKEKNKKIMSVYLKIILNYFQMISFIKTLNIKWPYYVESYMKSSAAVNVMSSNIFSIDCLADQYQIEGDVVHLKAAFNSLIPFCLLLVVSIILVFRYRKKRGNTNSSKIILAFFIILIFLHPMIIQSLFDNLSCIDIEGRKLNERQLTLDCNSDTHKKWLYFFIVPSLLLWLFIYPMSTLFYLYKNRRNLDNWSIRRKVGIFINGYRTKHFYWEFLIMYKKVTILFVSMFQLNIDLKAAILLFLSYFSLFVSKLSFPFVSQKLNNLELVSNISAFVILFSGSLYIHSVGLLWQALIFINIMIFNSSFLFLCFVSLMKIFLDNNIMKLQKICPFLYLRYISVLNSFGKNSNPINMYSIYKKNLQNEQEKFQKTGMKERKIFVLDAKDQSQKIFS